MITLNLDAAASDTVTRRTLSHLSLSVARCKKIVVVTGAGISCSCGIPDFRSSDGLYALVKEKYPNVVLKGRDLFDASLFRDSTSTSVFYTFISELKQAIDCASPAPTHNFIKTLDSKRKLLRSYTQNIDGLEERLGLLGSSSHDVKKNGKGKGKIRTQDVRNVQLHGDIHRVRCTFCSADFACTSEHLSKFSNGVAPDCPECMARSEARTARCARPLKVGTLRPAIVLYDEPHPLGDDIGTIQTADIGRKPDMLIIMGTSLKVHGFKKLVKDFAKIVRATGPSSPNPSTSTPKNARAFAGKVIFVNKTAPGSEWNGIIDYHVAGETDKWTEKVIEDWKKMRPSDWEVQKTLVSRADEDSGAFKVMKETSANVVKTNVAKGKTRRENIPPAPADILPLPTPTLKPPCSPSKRRKSGCHYNDLESSPSKKRGSGIVKEIVPMEERGMLFGDSTNKVEETGLGDGLTLGDTEVIRQVKKAGSVRSRKMKVEVMMEESLVRRRGRSVVAKV